MQLPSAYFLTSGVGEGSTAQNAADAARLAAGIGQLSLSPCQVHLPPNCRQCEPRPLTAGALTPGQFATISGEVPGEVISAAVAVAWPTDPASGAVVMEHAAAGHKEDIEAIARRMAEDGLRARGLKLRQLRSIAVQHRVQKLGSVVVALILCQDLR
jgi:arginine decarboxylase